MFTRYYHWRLDKTFDQWQCWLSFADYNYMTVVGLISAIVVSDAAVDVKKLFVEEIQEKLAVREILQEV